MMKFPPGRCTFHVKMDKFLHVFLKAVKLRALRRGESSVLGRRVLPFYGLPCTLHGVQTH
jgi:hypothetical protein